MWSGSLEKKDSKGGETVTEIRTRLDGTQGDRQA